MGTGRKEGRVCLAVSETVYGKLVKASGCIGCPKSQDVSIKRTAEILIEYALSKLPACE